MSTPPNMTEPSQPTSQRPDTAKEIAVAKRALGRKFAPLILESLKAGLRKQGV